MPPLSELPGSVSRETLLRALTRLGFIIDKSGGKGDHCKITWPRNQKSITLPYRTLPKKVLKYLLKEIETISNVNWERIRKEL